MKITIITLFPKMIEGFFQESIVRRAIDKKLLELEIINLRDFATDKYGSVDDRPYGGGAGMILRADIMYEALRKVFSFQFSVFKQIPNTKTILTSAKGQIFNQKKAINYSKLEHLIIIAGHYEGVDERVSGMVDEEISMGDFVTTGGEIPAAAIIDSIARLIPGVLKKEAATKLESFFTVSIDRLIEIIGEEPLLQGLKDKGVKYVTLLEYPQYTRPVEFNGLKVPAVLLSGDPKKIEAWQIKKAFEITLAKRKDLLMV